MSDIQACETVCPCVDICEIARLRAEVDDLKRINMNLRYLIPEAVWMDEADRLRGDNQESPANEIERLRALITAWADIQDEIDDLWTSRSPDDFEYTLPDLEKEEREACEALRKAVGR